MTFSLSLDTNPLVNRFADPEILIRTVAKDLQIKSLQLTHEFLNPSWPRSTLRRLTKSFTYHLQQTGVEIRSGMTGPYGRLNHFGHPDADVRGYYLEWFKRFSEIIVGLGGKSIGSQFAILTFQDFDDLAQREEMIEIAIDCWCEVAEHGKKSGLEFIFWEPMSIAREFGHTIGHALILQERLTKASAALPIWMMMDFDHGDVESPDPRDSDPREWARQCGSVSPIVHVKQSLEDKGGHRPFIPECNQIGRV